MIKINVQSVHVMESSMVNSMAAGLGHTSMANSLASSLANTNSMGSAFGTTSLASALANSNNMGGNSMAAGFGQKYLGEVSWNSQFGLGRNKSASELSPGSRKAAMTGLPSTSQSIPTQGQQAFNIQAGMFNEDEDTETGMFFHASSNIFRPDKDLGNQSQSPSQSAGFGNNFYSQGGLTGFSAVQQQQQQRGPVSAGPFQRSNALTPTSLNPSFLPAGSMPQHNSPSRGVISAIGGHRMMNSTQTSQAALSSLQKRPIGSGLPSTAAPISNLSSSFGFPTRGDSSQPNFDMSDFPTLGNRVTPSSSLGGSRNYVGMVSKNQVQDQTPEFQIQQEDFPALPGAQSTLSMFVSDPPTSSNGEPGKKQPMNLMSGSSYEQALSKDGKLLDDKSSSGSQRKGVQVHPDGRLTNIPASMVADQFGMVGLLHYIKMTEQDDDHHSIILVPGLDLTTLGLNLNSPENLYSTFQSPWVDLPCRPQDIDFHVPTEYLTNIYVRNKLAPIKLNRYGEDLLFFLFYMNGGDVLQLAAAAELFNRDWRYHKEERIWITRAPGVEPVIKTATYERGTYYFFDATSWRKVAKEFHLEYEKLQERPIIPTLPYSTQPFAAH